MAKNKLKITWYGNKTFLLESSGKKVLLNPDSDKLLETGEIETDDTRENKSLLNEDLDGVSVLFADEVKKGSKLDDKVKPDVAIVGVEIVDEDTFLQSGEIIVEKYEPQVIVAYYPFPETFVRQNPEPEVLSKYTKYKRLLDSFLRKISYVIEEIDSHEKSIDLGKYKEKALLLFKEIHPQVKYKDSDN